mmetsp:Transcript_124908/g.361299  ORF Transcript_124908/g.361299 Transcript_124908/m.361299 type:complete len:218 (+) Transcript_124908:823-1476(+)
MNASDGHLPKSGSSFAGVVPHEERHRRSWLLVHNSLGLIPYCMISLSRLFAYSILLRSLSFGPLLAPHLSLSRGWNPPQRSLVCHIIAGVHGFFLATNLIAFPVKDEWCDLFYPGFTEGNVKVPPIHRSIPMRPLPPSGFVWYPELSRFSDPLSLLSRVSLSVIPGLFPSPGTASLFPGSVPIRAFALSARLVSSLRVRFIGLLVHSLIRNSPSPDK